MVPHSTEQEKKLQTIIQKYGIKTLAEEELPQERKNVIKCEEKKHAFFDMKRRKFFQSLDMTQVNQKKRLEVMLESVAAVDKCHRQFQNFVLQYGPDDFTRAELHENIVFDNEYNENGEVVHRTKRTILEDVDKMRLTNTHQFFNNDRVQHFLTASNSQARRAAQNRTEIKKPSPRQPVENRHAHAHQEFDTPMSLSVTGEDLVPSRAESPAALRLQLDPAILQQQPKNRPYTSMEEIPQTSYSQRKTRNNRFLGKSIDVDAQASDYVSKNEPFLSNFKPQMNHRRTIQTQNRPRQML